MTLLDGLRVVDLSTEIAGPYATKLLADAGADVVKVEAPQGDPLRRWSASHVPLDGCDGALFRYLNVSKRSITGTIDGGAAASLLEKADLLVESGSLGPAQIVELRRRLPDLVVASVTPFGRSGPFADAPATEFTLQAWCGSTAGRGDSDRQPLHAGGRLGEWISGTYTAVGALAALHGGHGDHVDVSMLECMAITLGGFGAVFASVAGTLDVAKRHLGPVRTLEVPSILPTADGLVGFCTVTGQQFQDFLVMVERPDLIGDDRFASALRRTKHQSEFDDIVIGWTSTRTTDEIVELATAFRIPVTPIGTPSTIADDGALRGARGLRPQPRRRVRSAPGPVSGRRRRPPSLRAGPPPRRRSRSGGMGRLPVHGPADEEVERRGDPSRACASSTSRRSGPDHRRRRCSQRWGPTSSRSRASAGLTGCASTHYDRHRTRPGGSGARCSSPSTPGNVASPSTSEPSDGRRMLLDLVDTADALIENFSPRVLDGFGITGKRSRLGTRGRSWFACRASAWTGLGATERASLRRWSRSAAWRGSPDSLTASR